MPATIRLPFSLQRRLEAASTTFLHPSHGGRRVDFLAPTGEAALIAPDSTSWRIFKNPVALFIGGVAAVLLELADPAVRTGVWEHSTFRSDPLNRLRRTGLAAMVTIYGARSVSEPMIARIAGMHSRVTGRTPDGQQFAASDPKLLTWVHATATFGFAEAYSRYVESLSVTERDAVYREGAPILNFYGATDAPRSQRDANALFDSQRGRLEASPIVFTFLRIMAETPALPPSLAWLQRIMLRAAVDVLPDWTRERLGLCERYSLSRRENVMVKAAGLMADRIMLRDSPAAQSCLRLGLPAAYLYGQRR